MIPMQVVEVNTAKAPAPAPASPPRRDDDKNAAHYRIHVRNLAYSRTRVCPQLQQS